MIPETIISLIPHAKPEQCFEVLSDNGIKISLLGHLIYHLFWPHFHEMIDHERTIIEKNIETEKHQASDLIIYPLPEHKDNLHQLLARILTSHEEFMPS